MQRGQGEKTKPQGDEWHQSRNAAEFELERRRHHVQSSPLQQPGGKASDAGAPFDASQYAFFGDPGGSGLEGELGGLDDDDGGALEGGLGGLEDELDPSLLESQEADNTDGRKEQENRADGKDMHNLTGAFEKLQSNLSGSSGWLPPPPVPANLQQEPPPQQRWWPNQTQDPQQWPQGQFQPQRGPPRGPFTRPSLNAMSVEELEAAMRGELERSTQAAGPPQSFQGPPGYHPNGHMPPGPRAQYPNFPPPPNMYSQNNGFAPPPWGGHPQQAPQFRGNQVMPSLEHFQMLQQQQRQGAEQQRNTQQGFFAGGQTQASAAPSPALLDAMLGGPMGLPRQGSGVFMGQPHQQTRPPSYPPAPQEGLRPGMRSKYMSAEEIENIVRIQWSATHATNPYNDDFYYQAVQHKRLANSPHGRRHFAPVHLRELPGYHKAQAEPHAFLQVDGLGRVPFSSIRRPRPLLDVEDDPIHKRKNAEERAKSGAEAAPQRPLEQEPMLAARIAIEDGMCLLLDVDDIDRLIACSNPPDGGVQLRRRRQLLLEGLAASLQLSDTQTALGNAPPSNDLVFLRLVSLPKGCKLITRYLQLVPPGSDLGRRVVLVCMRHLRFLFGGSPSDLSNDASITYLAGSLASAIASLDLASLSACLATVLGAAELPPLRPMHSPAGDGATVVLRAVLDRATAVLTDQQHGGAVSEQARQIWRSNFDAFFALLAHYCREKIEAITAAAAQADGNTVALAVATLAAEVPAELLRASLPHASDHQKATLLDITRKAVQPGMAGASSSLPLHSGNMPAAVTG